jgi:peptidoglycan/LPS O-acetylase OafA/YrhL
VSLEPFATFFDASSEKAVGVISYSYIILMAVLIHPVIERPFEKIRARFRSKGQPISLGLSALLHYEEY